MLIWIFGLIFCNCLWIANNNIFKFWGVYWLPSALRASATQFFKILKGQHIWRTEYFWFLAILHSLKFFRAHSAILTFFKHIKFFTGDFKTLPFSEFCTASHSGFCTTSCSASLDSLQFLSTLVRRGHFNWRDLDPQVVSFSIDYILQGHHSGNPKQYFLTFFVIIPGLKLFRIRYLMTTSARGLALLILNKPTMKCFSCVSKFRLRNVWIVYYTHDRFVITKKWSKHLVVFSPIRWVHPKWYISLIPSNCKRFADIYTQIPWAQIYQQISCSHGITIT